MPQPTFDWTKTLWKAAKTAAVAAAAVLVADPSFAGALVDLAPAAWTPLLAIIVPTLVTALRNWLKHGGGDAIIDRVGK